MPLVTVNLSAIEFEARVKACFLSQYAWASTTASPFYYMQQYYPPRPDDGHLPAAVLATSIAFFSSLWSDREIYLGARKQYDSALRLTRAALGSRDIAKRDTTLIAILLLNSFERFFNRNTDDEARREASHLKGAIALVGHRGEEQFHEGSGMNIFRQLNEYILLDCLRRASPVPSNWLATRKLAEKYIDANDLGWRFSLSMCEFASLHASLSEEQPTVEHVQRAKQLDEELINISRTFAERTSTTETKFSLVRKAMSRLLDIHTAFKAWKNIRVVRILLHEMILDQCLRGCLDWSKSQAFDVKGQIQESTRIIQNLSTEIRNYVPQYVQRVSSSFISEVRDEAFSVVGFTIQAPDIMFPFYIIYRSPVTPEPVRQSVSNQLRTWCNKAGVFASHAMSKALDDEGESHKNNVWEVWWNIGGEAFVI